MTLSKRTQAHLDRIGRTVRIQLHGEIDAVIERLAAEYPGDPAMAARCHGLEIARRIVSPMPVDEGEARCSVCGCTESDACEGGCWWVPNPGMRDLCSSCAPPESCATPGCGAENGYLDTSIQSRSGWIRVGMNGWVKAARMYCSPQCAAAALTAGSTGQPGKVTPAGGGITQAEAGAGTAPLLLRWDHVVSLPGLGSPDTEVRVSCRTGDDALAFLVVGPEERLALASLLDAEVRDITKPCGMPGCGTPVIGTDSPDHPRWWGWAQVRVVGVDVGLRWACSPPCVSDALARAGVKLAAADEDAEYEAERAFNETEAGW